MFCKASRTKDKQRYSSFNKYSIVDYKSTVLRLRDALRNISMSISVAGVISYTSCLYRSYEQKSGLNILETAFL